MKWLLIAMALSACSGSVAERQQQTANEFPPGTLGGYCEANRDCLLVPRFADCSPDHRCRAWCKIGEWHTRAPSEGLEENCYAMGGSCAEDGECVR